MKLQLDDMQATMPNLRVLKLSGVGGFYGESRASVCLHCSIYLP